MKSFTNINKNNLFFGEHMLLGEFSTNWETYQQNVDKAIQDIWNGYIETFNASDKNNEKYLENLRNTLLDNFQNFAGRYIAIINIDDYSCACTIDEGFAKATCYRLLLLTNQYVRPFDEKRRYPTQMIETKTTWKY